MLPWIQLGDWALPSFLLVQSLNACLLLWWTSRRAQAAGYSIKKAMDLGFVILVCGLIGGRLFHVLWEAPDYYQQNPTQILNLFSGGYVYFGGFLFALLGAFVTIRLFNEARPGDWFDFFAPIVSLGTAIGRFGCFLAGCCYGKICTLPWAIPVVDEKGLHFLRHPTQIYSLLWELGILLILLGLEKMGPRRPFQRSGSLFLIWMGLHGLGRFFIEFLRDDFRGLFFGGLSISQWISLVMVLVACLILRQFSAHPRRTPQESPK